MKKIYFFAVSAVSMLAVSCGGASLSNGAALDQILLENENQCTEQISIPKGLKPLSQIEDEMPMYRVFENAGLLTIKDSVVKTRYWGNYEAVDINITDKGRTAVDSEDRSSYDVTTYTYEYDKVVDLKLLASKTVEECDATIQRYIAFYSGHIVSVSPFGTALGVAVEELYPFTEGEDEKVMGSSVSAIFRGSKLIETDVIGEQEIYKAKIDEAFDSEWVDVVEDFN